MRRRVCSPAAAWPRQQGFSLLELGIALAALGALGLLIAHAYGDNASNAVQRAHADLAQASDALHAFALTHQRLPCPDLDGNGYEGDAGGTCASDARSGWLPYHALELPPPPPAQALRYAVYRHATATADLVAQPPLPTTGDPGSGQSAFQQALVNAAGQPIRADQAYLTGDGAALGAIDCAGNRVLNPAFVLAAGVVDRDGDGNRFDSPHSTSAGLCFAAPSRPVVHGYDDRVLSVAAPALLGWLRTQIR